MEANLLQQLSSTGPAELLIASIWQGLLLTAVAWAALQLAPGLRASTRFTVWMIVFTLIALLPCFAAGRAFFAAPGLFAPAAAQPAGFALRINIVWAFVIEGFWAAASVFALGRLWASVCQMRSLLRNSTPVEIGEEMQSFLAHPGARPSSRPVEVRLSDAVDSPSVIGFFRPAVVVPRSLWNQLTSAELQQIILHEMAHLDRGDDWTNLLQKLLRALSPLNPALFWAERNLCLERERACDDAVLDTAGNPRAYASCLTKLAESRLVKRAAMLAPGFWKRHSELAGRVHNILHHRRAPRPFFSRSLVATTLFASLLGVLLLQLCPGIVTFAGRPVAANPAPAEPASFARVAAPQMLDQYQPRYQEAVFHPAGSVVQPVAQPKPHTPRRAASARRLRFLEVRSNQDGVTLILFTVDVPRNANVDPTSITLPTPDNWIAFQI
jgi:beta-lactamase regulating signal transducer with metallopeptidase domain